MALYIIQKETENIYIMNELVYRDIGATGTTESAVPDGQIPTTLVTAPGGRVVKAAQPTQVSVPQIKRDDVGGNKKDEEVDDDPPYCNHDETMKMLQRLRREEKEEEQEQQRRDLSEQERGDIEYYIEKMNDIFDGTVDKGDGKKIG